MENIGTRGRLMYAGIGLVFAILLTLYFVYQVALVALVFLLTLLFSIIISAPVDYLARRGLRRGWGLLAVLGGLALILGLAGFALGSAIEGQVQQLVESFPTLLSSAQDSLQQLQGNLGLESDIIPAPQQLLESAQSLFSGGTLSTAFSVGAGVANVLSLMAVVFVATIYAVALPRPLVNGFVALFPAGRRERVRDVLGKMYKTVQWWFLGQLTSMFVIGTLFTVALFLIGIPFALILGIFSGLLAFIPFVGPLISVIPPILLALAQDPIAAVWVILAYLIVQAIESNVIQPVVMNRAVSLHPVVVVFALLIMGTLFGFVGVLLAVPLTAALQVLAREMWVKRMDEEGTDPNPSAEENPTKTRERMDWPRRAARVLFRRS